MKYELKPVKYSIGLDEYSISIEERSKNRWAVLCGSMCMNAEGTFEYEPSPSNRDEKFLQEHRFNSPEEALKAFEEKATLIINGRNVKTGEIVIRK